MQRYASAGTSVARCLSVCLSVCLCLSVTGRRSVKTVGRIKLVFGMEASFDLSYSVLKRNICRIGVLPSGTVD